MTDLELFVRRLVDRLQEKNPDGIHRPVTVREVRRGLLPYRVYRNALRLTNGEDYDLLLLRLCAEEGGYVRTNPSDAAERCREEVASPNPDLSFVADLDEVTVQIGAGALQRVMGLEVDEAPDPSSDPIQAPSDLPLLPLDAPEPPPAARPVLEEPIVDAALPAEPWEPVLPAARPSRPEPVPPSEPRLRLSRPEPQPKPVLRLSRSEPPPPEPPASGAGLAPRCPHCREALPRGRRVMFCPFCGERMDPVRCSRCGTELEPGWRHCITCGRPTTSDGAYV